MKTNRFLLAVGFGLALVFTASCSGEDNSSETTPGNGASSDSQGGSDCSIDGYKTVTMGDQIWMAENLNCNVSGSRCYRNDPANCTVYGRLYDWATAMSLPSNCNYSNCASQVQSRHRGICPSGWHLPSDDELAILEGYAGSYTAGSALKAESGWTDCGPEDSGSFNVCSDEYGFSALPGGSGWSVSDFDGIGSNGLWWSSTEDNATELSGRLYIYYGSSNVIRDNGYKFSLNSVRCLKD